jgi:hypothetical protein
MPISAYISLYQPISISLSLSLKSIGAANVAEVLSSASTIAMDAEWVPETKGVAILQLATWEEVHIWDLQAWDVTL